MSNARIIEIPATRQIRSGKNNTMRKMRVAAYCRVSTEEEEQQGSFETQKLYYTEKINSTSEWELAGIYADDGISGIHTKKRDGFNQMIQDCKKKKIDLILTKSISRFARNTLDSIQYVRMLKAIGIAVIFEKENINTSTMNSEMILTVLSAFAQAESESISQNVARGKRMGFRQGKFPFPYGQILGYRKGLDGKPEVIPEEAEVIRMIFNSYLQGASLLTIKKKLEAGGVLTARGNKKWSSESVQRILQNEKYCGDVLLQKTFIEDVLTGVSKKNTGQLPQYYIENNHEGIVTKQMFREVQAEIARRNSKSAANQRKRHQGRYNSKYALSERLVCGDCGSPYKRVTWNIHGRKQIVWRCVNRLEYGTKFCSHSPSIPEEELHQAILKAVQNLAANFTDEVAAQLDGILRQMKAGENLKAQLQKQLEKAQQEFDRLLEMSLELDESTPFLDDKLRKLSGKIKILKANIAESTDGKGEDEEATKQLTAQDLLIKEYDDILTARIIEKVIVHSRQEIEIYFIEEFGNLFVGALKGVAPVLVFVIVASALAQGSSKLDRRFGTVVWLYMLTTFVAAALSVVTSKLFPQTLVLAEAATADVVPQGLGDVMHTLLSNIVSNPVASIMNGNYIGILMWACLFGLAMKKLGSDTTKNFMANTADAISTIVRWIINLAPFGIMGLVFTNVSDNGLSIFTQYGRLLLLLVGTMLLMALVINPFIIFIYLHRNPYPLVFRCLRESGLTAFFTRSSAANIPVNMSLCEKLGLDKDIYSVSIPLGATINMDGAAITITIMTLAAANTLGMQVSVPAAILLSVMSALGACGASGVAGGSLLLIPMACSLFGISNDIAMQVVGVGFIIGVIQDSVETALNSAGDVEFAATAEYHQWLKEDKPLPAFMGGK